MVASRRKRRQSYDAKKIAEICRKLESLTSRVAAIADAMRRGRIRTIEFDGASAIDRATAELESWVRLATIDVIVRRGDLPDLN